MPAKPRSEFDLPVDVPWVYSREGSGRVVATCEALRLAVEARDHAHLLESVVEAHRTILELATEWGQVPELFKAARWPAPRAMSSRANALPTFQLVVSPSRGRGGLAPTRALEVALRVHGFTAHGARRQWTVLRNANRPGAILLPAGDQLDEVTASAILRHAGMPAEAAEVFRATYARG